MKKLLLLCSLIIFFNLSYSQTIEITSMSITTSSDPLPKDYKEMPIEIYYSENTYYVQQVTFTWSDFDSNSQPIQFALWQHDGTLNTIQGYSLYTGEESGSTVLYTLANPINNNVPRDINFTIQAFYYDENHDEQFLAESDPWIITSIPDPIGQIIGNTLCCDQTTFKYPFDPVAINQASNTTVSTEDNAPITSVQWQKLTGTTWTNITGATQYSYDPPSINGNTKYRRVLTSSSGVINNSAPVSITKITERISGNSICCSQTTAVMPFDPAIIAQKINTTVSSNVGSSVTFTYQWQDSINGAWNNISGATIAHMIL